MLIDSIGEEGHEVGVRLPFQGAEQPSRTGIVGAVPGNAQQAVRVSNPELRTAARLGTARRAIFGLTIPVKPDQHEIDQALDIQVVLHELVVVAVIPNTIPTGTVQGVGRTRYKGAADIVVSPDGKVVRRRTAEMIGQEMIHHALAQMVLSPVDPVQVEVDETPVWIQAPHVQHAVVRIPVGHVKTPRNHVV